MSLDDFDDLTYYRLVRFAKEGCVARYSSLLTDDRYDTEAHTKIVKNIPITPEFLFVSKLGQGTFISDFNGGCI